MPGRGWAVGSALGWQARRARCWPRSLAVTGDGGVGSAGKREDSEKRQVPVDVKEAETEN